MVLGFFVSSIESLSSVAKTLNDAILQMSGKSATSESAISSGSSSNNAMNSAKNGNLCGKSSRSWTPDAPPVKRNAVTVASTFRAPALRTIHVIFRAFRLDTEVMGYAVWNSFYWRDTIDREYGYPANSYMRIEDIATNEDEPSLIDDTEGNAYVSTGMINMNTAQSLAHLFLFSISERSFFRLGNTQPRGFHFVSKRGLTNVALEKWLQHDNGDLLTLNEDELTFEMEDSNARCQIFLENECHRTQQPDTPGVHMDAPAMYVLHKQRRLLTTNMLPLFDRVMDCSRGNVSRPQPEHDVQNDIGTV